MTHCNTKTLACTPLTRKKLEFDFDGGKITTHAGVILLREVEKRIRLFDRVAEVLVDKRTSPAVVHTVRNMLAQRVMALCIGCEDLNDHNELRNDPALQIAVTDNLNKEVPLASPPTLCRWERRVNSEELLAINKLLVDIFLDTFMTPPKELVLDFDSTDCPLFGNQEGRHFNGYYDEYCYTPLYVTRKVICKAEYNQKGPNTRFIVTNLPGDAQSLYEDVYCARGDMENRIKENKLFLFSCRTSSRFFCANQLRLLLSGLGYVLMNEMRRTVLADTALSEAQCDTIREKAIKIGARVLQSVRRVLFHLSSSYPFRELFTQIWEKLRTPSASSADFVPQLE